MLEIKNLTKKYGQLEVYANFDLSLEEGKITCILGESGCGKTTLLNCIAGLTGFEGDVPDCKCSYVFQSPRLVPNLTVYGNLSLVCKDSIKIKAMLESVHLSDKSDAYPKSLSGGQAQRVALARAFLFESDLLLMDEPFSSLDLKLKREMTELFFEIWRRDSRTVLFVTHDIDEAISVADRIIVLKSGKTVLDVTVGECAPRAAAGNEDLRNKLIIAVIDG